MPRGRGNHRPHGRPADAPDPLHQQRGSRQQGAGGAGGDKGVPLPVFQHGQPHRQGGVLLALECRGRIIADLHHLFGVDNLHALRQWLGQAGTDGLFPSHQHNVRAALGVRLQSALYNCLGRVVAAHGIQNNLHGRFLLSGGQAPADGAGAFFQSLVRGSRGIPFPLRFSCGRCRSGQSVRPECPPSSPPK